MFDHHEDICPICGRPGDHWLCDEIEVDDWNASFGLDQLKD